MNFLIVTFLLSLLSTNNLLSWIIPFSLDVSWNSGKRTFLLVGSYHKGPFGAFMDKQDFLTKTFDNFNRKQKLSIKGKEEVSSSYNFLPVSYADASALEKGTNKYFVWVNEQDILRGFKQKKGGTDKQTIHHGITNFFKRQGTPSTSVSPISLYASDGTRKTWGAASNNTWTHFFKDTVYANKPTTMGPGVDFRKYYSFMNTYPEGNMPPEANQGAAPIKLGLYYDINNIGNPIHTWYHAESYYQAMKKVHQNGTYDHGALAQVLDWDKRGDIMQIYGAYKGKISGLRQDWQTINLFIMLDIVRAKFMQNKNMRDILLSTGDKYIVEETTDRSPKAKDSFFGNEVGQFDSKLNTWITDPNKQPGMGSNILGQILMHVRKELKAGTLLPLTLYTEPLDFFNVQKGKSFAPSGKSWNFLPTQSGLKQPCDTPLLIPPVIIPPIRVPPVIVPPLSETATLQIALNEFIVALRQLASALGVI